MNAEDRELLDLAAKAAGIEWTENDEVGNLYQVRHDIQRLVIWNPLTDDGDAFRLAAHLRIGIEYDGDYVIVAGAEEELPVVGQEEIEGIVRRLIVEAAAEIGRSMP